MNKLKINKNLMIFPFFILFLIFLYRSCLAFFFFGGSDSTNINSFSLLFDYDINLYSIKAHWPYLPLANSFLIFCNLISKNFSFETIQIYKVLITFFDFLLSCLIFSFWSKNHPIKLSLLISSLYLINPLSTIIVTILGFNDSVSLYFLIISLFLLKDDEHNFFSIIFLCLSISLKPMTFILIPYFLYKSKNSIYVLLSIILFLFLLNFYYIYEFGFLNFFEIIKYISYKIVYGHQTSGLGISFFDFILNFNFLKLLTVVGIILTLILYVNNLNTEKFYFIAVIFISLIIFRYNAHPQYFIWSVPLLFLTNKWRIASVFTLISGVTIFAYIFHWDKNGASFSIISNLINYISPNTIYPSDLLLLITNIIYSIGNIACLIIALLIIQFDNITSSIKNTLFKTFLFIRSADIFYLILNFSFLFLVLILTYIYDSNFFDMYNIKQFVIFLIPLFFISYLASIKNDLQFRFIIIYFSTILLIVLSLFFKFIIIDKLSYLILIFLIINFKNLINTFFYNQKNFDHHA